MFAAGASQPPANAGSLVILDGNQPAERSAEPPRQGHGLSQTANALAEHWRASVEQVWGPASKRMPRVDDAVEGQRWVELANTMGVAMIDLVPLAQGVLAELHQAKHDRGEGPPSRLSYATPKMLEVLGRRIQPLPHARFAPPLADLPVRSRRKGPPTAASQFLSQLNVKRG